MATVQVHFDEDYVKRLATILGKPNNYAAQILQKVAEAGSRELVDYCTGTVVPTTFSEVRVNTLDYLYRAGIALEELEQVAAHLLQVPQVTAATILRNASARFAYDWEHDVMVLVKRALAQLKPYDGLYLVPLQSPLTLAWVNNQIKASGNPKIVATDMAGTYSMTAETYNAIWALVKQV